MDYRAGVDIGGTKTHTIALAPSGAIVAEVRRPTGFGEDAVLESAARGLHEVAAQLGITPAEFTTIGVGVPGLIDRAAGTVSHAINIGVRRLDLVQGLRERLGVLVSVENDVKAAALGAALRLAPTVSSLAYLNLGTGLAAGLVLDGRLWRGGGGTAGEIGHIPVDPLGHVCVCGQRGCLEAVASGAAVAREWPTPTGSAIAHLLQAVEAADPKARLVLEKMAGNIAVAVKVLVLTLDVEAVVLGGGLSTAGAGLRSAIVERLDRDAATSEFLGALRMPERVVLLEDSASVGAQGAALVAAAEQPAAT